MLNTSKFGCIIQVVGGITLSKESHGYIIVVFDHYHKGTYILSIFVKWIKKKYFNLFYLRDDVIGQTLKAYHPESVY